MKSLSLPPKLKLLSFLALLVLSACGDNGDLGESPTDPLAAEGQRLFKQNCATCHSVEPDSVIVGPSLAGIASRAEQRMEAVDGSEYLLLSIMKPSEYVVEGFSDLMPSNFGKSLSGEQLDALVVYLLTLQ